MKTGARTSRSGRPQKQTEPDVNSVPTEVSKFITKHSPKRLKPKESNQKAEAQQGESFRNITAEGKLPKSPSEDKENSSNFEETKNVPPEIETKNLPPEVEQRPVNAVIKEDNIMPVVAEFPPPDYTSLANNENSTSDIETTSNEDTAAGDVETCDVEKEETSEAEKEKMDMSDTDSALGSASSCNDEFIAGQILWGSFSRASWYPCMVYPDAEGNVIGKWNK